MKFRFKKYKEIPVFFACDDNYIPLLGVAIHSLIKNSSPIYHYNIYVLNSGLKEENKERISKYNKDNVSIIFYDVSRKIMKLKDKLSSRLRDYYSDAIYYRLFIPTIFKKYPKAIYLDADLVVVDDISKLYFTDISDYLVGAVHDQITNNKAYNAFRGYVTDAVGVHYTKYFNSGMLLMNLNMFRRENIESKFIHLLNKYNFDTVCPDQDYLNALCRDKVKYLNIGWNRMPIPNENFKEEDIKIIHYNSFDKPWHYDNILYKDYFWSFAKETEFYADILKIKENFNDARVEKDKVSLQKFIANVTRIAQDEPITFNNILFNKESEAYVNTLHEQEAIALENFLNTCVISSVASKRKLARIQRRSCDE